MRDRVRVGLFADALEPTDGDPERLRATLGQVADAGVDHLCVGDHVSFFVGAGSDGLISATSLLAVQAALPVYVGLYLLPLRHPVTVARQLATIAQLAPGRLTLGVGLGGEDRHEIEVCGVDPKTRGRRMDECLHILRGLADGTPVTFDGEFFALDDALILPAPSPSIPLDRGRTIGCRGQPRRDGSATAGSGSGSRPAGTARCAITSRGRPPRSGGTRAGSSMPSTSGAASRRPMRQPASCSPRRCRPSTKCRSSRSSATRRTGRPKTSRSSCAPTSTPAARRFNVIPCARDDDHAIAAVGELRTLLTASVATVAS